MRNLKKVIGIISYLPDEEEVRGVRLQKLTNLVIKCNQLFNLPIIIIAQNWKDVSINQPNLIVYRYEDKLGIVGARKELRGIFLSSDCDYLIMLDDDCELLGNSGQEYLRQIDNHPNCFCEFSSSLLKLFAISKFIFEKQNYLDDFNPETGEGFEDRVFVSTLRKRFPENRYIFKNTGLIQRSVSTRDTYSTWYSNQDISSMNIKTKEFIKKLEES